MWSEDVKIIVTGPHERPWKALFEKPYNPPREPLGEEFSNEFHGVLDGFLALLEPYGLKYGSVNDPSDFAVNEYHNGSRWIELCLHSLSLLQTNLPELIMGYLRSLKVDYAVWLTWDYFRGLPDDAEPAHFDVIFQRHEVVVSLLEEGDYADLVERLHFPARPK